MLSAFTFKKSTKNIIPCLLNQGWFSHNSLENKSYYPNGNYYQPLGQYNIGYPLDRVILDRGDK